MLTDEQLTERKKYLGSSDAAAALGLSRWKTSLQLWAEKTGRIVPDDISSKIPVRMGNKLEEAVAELFMEETGKKVRRANITKIHSDHDFLAANIDRQVVGEDAILEIKTASGWKKKEWEGEDIPQEYVIQVMHQMAVTGCQLGYIACLIGNEEFVWKEIKRDEKLLAEIVAKEVAWWNSFVAPNIMPMTLTADDGSTLYQLFPTSDPNADVILDDEVNILIEQNEAMRTEIDLLDKQVESNKNMIKAKLGKAIQGRTDLYQVTWKEQKGSTYTVERKATRVLRYKSLTKQGK